ncbi:MAG: hypothetical protein KBT55_08095 [Porticoccus sp.]|nr:hypothetical protein [Porticoccus sp.]
MQYVNDVLKILTVGAVSFFMHVGQIYAEDGAAQNDQKVLESMFERSPQIIIGRFELESKDDITNLNSNEPVEINFLIERHIKGVDQSVESIGIPIPYDFFLLRTDEGMDDFRVMMWKHAQQLNVKKKDFLRGDLSEDEWLLYERTWSQEFDSYSLGLLLYNSIRKGLDMSFNPDVEYVLFLRNYFDGDYINWAYTISQRTFSLGSGTFADLLLEE